MDGLADEEHNRKKHEIVRYFELYRKTTFDKMS